MLVVRETWLITYATVKQCPLDGKRLVEPAGLAQYFEIQNIVLPYKSI
jgi:glycyl-tRNA synthetase alpha subunit